MFLHFCSYTRLFKLVQNGASGHRFLPLSFYETVNHDPFIK